MCVSMSGEMDYEVDDSAYLADGGAGGGAVGGNGDSSSSTSTSK